MTDIASRSCYATAGVLCNIHHIARLVLHQIREDHRIVGYAQEASTSHGPSIRPPVSSTPARMQPIRGRGRGRVDHRGRGRDGGPGHGPDSDSGLGTLEPTLPTSIPSHTYPSPEMFITPRTYTSPSIPPYIDTSPSLPPHTYTSPSILLNTYTSPSIPPHTYTSVPYPVSPETASILVDITLSSHPLPSHTLPPIDDTILDLLPEWVNFQLGDLVLDVYIDYFIHQLPWLHQLLQICLKLHGTLLPNRLYILGAVVREI